MTAKAVFFVISKSGERVAKLIPGEYPDINFIVDLNDKDQEKVRLLVKKKKDSIFLLSHKIEDDAYILFYKYLNGTKNIVGRYEQELLLVPGFEKDYDTINQYLINILKNS